MDSQINVANLPPAEVVTRDKSLAHIERGFRVLKSEIEIGPVLHRLPDRIRAHESICFIAMILYRVMRQRLTAAKSGQYPEHTLAKLRQIQHHQIRLSADSKPITSISKPTDDQNKVIAVLNLNKSSKPQQLPISSPRFWIELQ
jgi:transposase